MHPRSVESSVSLFFHCLPFFCTEELLYCQAVFSANGYRIRHCSGVAALEDVAAQQSLSSGSAKRAHGSQFIPGGVNQQFLGLLRVCVGVVEENQSIFGQDSITHLPSVLGAVAFVIFLKFTAMLMVAAAFAVLNLSPCLLVAMHVKSPGLVINSCSLESITRSFTLS